MPTGSTALSLPAKIDDPLAALNLAFMSNGVVLRIDDGVKLSAPIEIQYLGDTRGEARAFHHRHVIALGKGSACTVVERFTGTAADPYWTHHHSDVVVGAEAHCRYFKVQDEGAQAIHLAAVNAAVGKAGSFDSFVLTTGGGLSRHEITVSLDAPGATCRLDGCYLGRNRQHIDNTTDIRHAAPETTSSETYKGVLDEQAHGVFQGRITVQPHAQKIDGHQLNKTILLSDRAEMDTKPELEIYADDVKCSHGATIGELDENAVFYLRARGIGLAEARQMLVEGFIEDLIGAVDDPARSRSLPRPCARLAGASEPGDRRMTAAAVALSETAQRADSGPGAGPPGFPDPGAAGPRPPPGVPGQRRHRPEAARGDRRDARTA